MNFVSADLSRYAAYPDVTSFQVDLRRYHWPLKPIKRIQGRNRYTLADAVTAHCISILRHMNIPSSSIKTLLDRIDQAAFRAALDEFEANQVDQIILTIPCARYFEPDDATDLHTVHTNLTTALETLAELDAIYINLSEISQAIRDGEL